MIWLRFCLIFVLATLAFDGLARAQMRKIYELPPVPYPEACLDRRIEGTVILRFFVTPSGKIRNIKVAKEVAQCPQFTAAALAAVRKAYVYPLPSGTRLLKQSIEVPITFSISQNDL